MNGFGLSAILYPLPKTSFFYAIDLDLLYFHRSSASNRTDNIVRVNKGVEEDG